MAPGDRLVCAFVEGQMVGLRFKRWPLHVTIVPWFRLDEASDVIVQGLERALVVIQPFELTASGTAQFGPRGGRPASLLSALPEIFQAEEKVRTYLHKKRAWLVDETTKKRYDFRPHVTVQGDTQLHDGDTFLCDRLYIVEQKGDYKEITNEVYFGR